MPEMLLSITVLNLKLHGQYELHQKEKHSSLKALVLVFFQPPDCYSKNTQDAYLFEKHI